MCYPCTGIVEPSREVMYMYSTYMYLGLSSSSPGKPKDVHLPSKSRECCHGIYISVLFSLQLLSAGGLSPMPAE